MHSAVKNANCYQGVLLAALAMTTPALSAALMSRGQQNGLVRKYCATCHTDAVKNGGLSLEHYDAADADPALAAMLLSKLNGGAMGAAGVRIPDEATRDAWIAATAAQAEQAKSWTVTRTEARESKALLLAASIVRDVTPREPKGGTPLYRLTVSCNIVSRQGEIQLAWSPQPQTNRIFSVSADGNPGIPHKLEGKEEKMGNGSSATTGLAAATLKGPLPEKTLTITDLFLGETVVFPLGDLDPAARQQLDVCLSNRSK